MRVKVVPRARGTTFTLIHRGARETYRSRE